MTLLIKALPQEKSPTSVTGLTPSMEVWQNMLVLADLMLADLMVVLKMLVDPMLPGSAPAMELPGSAPAMEDQMLADLSVDLMLLGSHQILVDVLLVTC